MYARSLLQTYGKYMAIAGDLFNHQQLNHEVVSLLVTLYVWAAFGCFVDVKCLCLALTVLCVTWDLKIKVVYILLFIRVIELTNNYVKY